MVAQRQQRSGGGGGWCSRITARLDRANARVQAPQISVTSV